MPPQAFHHNVIGPLDAEILGAIRSPVPLLWRFTGSVKRSVKDGIRINVPGAHMNVIGFPG